MGAHQHGHIAGLHLGLLVQQGHHLRGKAMRHMFQLQRRAPILGVLGWWQVPHGQGGQRLALGIAEGYGVAAAIDLGEFDFP